MFYILKNRLVSSEMCVSVVFAVIFVFVGMDKKKKSKNVQGQKVWDFQSPEVLSQRVIER